MEAEIGGDLDCDCAEIGGSVDCEGAKIAGDLCVVSARVGEEVDCIGSKIGGHADFTDANIADSLLFTDSEIGGNLFCEYAEIGGELLYIGARIAGALCCMGSKIKGVKIGEPTEAEIEFLRSIPIDRLRMEQWHGGGWKPSEPGDCGTTHCLAGWAQAKSGDLMIRKMEPSAAGRKLIPNLSYLFYASDEIARNEIAMILAQSDVSTPAGE
jgi:hypothetical protein